MIPQPVHPGPWATPALRAEGLTRRFGDPVAVGGIGFEAHRGEALAPLGPNGAGAGLLLAGVPRSRLRAAPE